MENGQKRTVGAAFRLPSGPAGRPLRRAVAVVDRVHVDGDLPTVPVEFGEIADGEAFLEIDPDAQQPRRIIIDRDSMSPAWSLIHEIGHLLDYSALGEPGVYGSTADPALADWRKAIAASGSYRRLRSLFEHQDDPYLLRSLARLTEYSEFWARSYAQYVAVKSGDSRLLGHLDWRRQRSAHWAYTHLQWDDSDFVVIADEIDVIFRRLRWTK